MTAGYHHLVPSPKEAWLQFASTNDRPPKHFSEPRTPRTGHRRLAGGLALRSAGRGTGGTLAGSRLRGAGPIRRGAELVAHAHPRVPRFFSTKPVDVASRGPRKEPAGRRRALLVSGGHARPHRTGRRGKRSAAAPGRVLPRSQSGVACWVLATGQRGSYGRAHDGTIAGSTVCNEGERTKWPRPISETDCVEHSMGSISQLTSLLNPLHSAARS